MWAWQPPTRATQSACAADRVIGVRHGKNLSAVGDMTRMPSSGSWPFGTIRLVILVGMYLFSRWVSPENGRSGKLLPTRDGLDGQTGITQVKRSASPFRTASKQIP